MNKNRPVSVSKVCKHHSLINKHMKLTGKNGQTGSDGVDERCHLAVLKEGMLFLYLGLFVEVILLSSSKLS